MSDAELFERLYAAAWNDEDLAQVPGATPETVELVLTFLRLDKEAQTAALVSNLRSLADAVERFLDENPGAGTR